MVVWLLTCCGFQLPFTGDLPLGGCFCLASTVCVLSGGIFALCGDLGGEGGVTSGCGLGLWRGLRGCFGPWWGDRFGFTCMSFFVLM